MATSVRWVYPYNWDYTYPETRGFARGVVQAMANYESTGTNDETVVPLAPLYDSNGNKATRLAVDRIKYNVSGFTEVYLYFDDEYSTPIASVSGDGEIVFPGGVCNPDAISDTSDWSGDIKMTSYISSGTGSFDILINVRPKV